MISHTTERHYSSFRDPSGFMFTRDGELFRQVNLEYKDNYDLLFSSGLYKNLTDSHLLIGHEEVSAEPMDKSLSYKVLKPEKIPYISYPSEWCFSQLKDAALLTLDILLKALDCGMILKDASAYNVQFLRGKPILVDSLSFEAYIPGQPWIAYRQFCQHFLAPLALMAYKDTRLNKMSTAYIDGIPLDLASNLLPASSWFNYRLLTHLHLHSRWQANTESKTTTNSQAKLSKEALTALLDDLRNAVVELKLPALHSNWTDYTENNNYNALSAADKKRLIADYLERAKPREVIDLGANTGDYSRQASSRSALTISADFDHDSVDLNYRRCVTEGEQNILPLVIDLANPTSAFGFENNERMSFTERGNVDLVMALALVHHLAIANNVPFVNIARFLSRLGKYLIIEFVPKEDSQVQRLLSSRKDIFADYSQETFEKAFLSYFTIDDVAKIAESSRSLYLMRSLSDK